MQAISVSNLQFGIKIVEGDFFGALLFLVNSYVGMWGQCSVRIGEKLTWL